MRLTARGTAGHGSMINRDNAVTELAEAIGRWAGTNGRSGSSLPSRPSWKVLPGLSASNFPERPGLSSAK